MPCYEPPPTEDEEYQWWLKAKEKGDWNRWFDLTPSKAIEQWLCDALKNNPISEDCERWWTIHMARE